MLAYGGIIECNRSIFWSMQIITQAHELVQHILQFKGIRKCVGATYYLVVVCVGVCGF